MLIAEIDRPHWRTGRAAALAMFFQSGLNRTTSAVTKSRTVESMQERVALLALSGRLHRVTPSATPPKRRVCCDLQKKAWKKLVQSVIHFQEQHHPLLGNLPDI